MLLPNLILTSHEKLHDWLITESEVTNKTSLKINKITITVLAKSYQTYTMWFKV